MIAQLFETLAQFCLNLISSLGYPGIALVMALENIFPPIPSELVMPFAGFLVSKGRFDLILTIAMGVLGSIAGALVFYFVGFFFGKEQGRKFIIRWGKYALVSEKDLQNGERWFNRFGEWSVFLARVVPVVRSIISVPAGFVKMPMSKFLALTFCGTLIWTTFLTYLGVILGENWGIVGPFSAKFDYLVILIIFVGVIFYLYRKLKPK